MKKIIVLLLVFLMVVGSAISFTGCGETKEFRSLTREEWINKLGRVFNLYVADDLTQIFSDVKPEDTYYNVIQACAEWNIIEKSDKFNPKERADVEFAILTAIKAIGLEKIEMSVGGRKLASNQEIVDYFNENAKTNISGSILTEDISDQIIMEMNRINSGLTYEQYQKIVYSSEVKVLAANDVIFLADGQTGKIRNGNYSVGDILVVEPCEFYPMGKYAKITSIDNDTLTYSEPEIDEILDDLAIRGTYSPNIICVVPEDEGVTVELVNREETSNQGTYNNNGRPVFVSNNVGDYKAVKLGSTNVQDLKLSINKKIKDVNITGTVGLSNILISCDVNDFWNIIRRYVYCKVNSTAEIGVNVSGKISHTMNLASVYVSLYGCVGAKINVNLLIGLEGNINIVYSIDTTGELEYRNIFNKKYNFSTQNQKMSLDAKAKAYALLENKAILVVGGCDITSLDLSTGVEADVEFKFDTQDKVACLDLKAFVPLTWGVDTNKRTVLGKLGFSYRKVLWDGNNSPIKISAHYEDEVKVDECTLKDKDDKKEQEEVNTAVNDPNYNPEYDKGFSIEDQNEHLVISSFYLVMEEGLLDTLVVEKCPAGYDESAVVFSSSDTNVVSIDKNGLMTAVNQGVCMVKVETSDGKYYKYCTIYVTPSYDVEFTPLNI